MKDSHPCLERIWDDTGWYNCGHPVAGEHDGKKLCVVHLRRAVARDQEKIHRKERVANLELLKNRLNRITGADGSVNFVGDSVSFSVEQFDLLVAWAESQ